MKLTPWIPGTVKPVRAGLYQRLTHSNLVVWSKWDGAKWMRCMFTQPNADTQVIESLQQDIPWRGVAK